MTRYILAMALAAITAMPAVQATHMGTYYNEPVEHDLLGQIPEPDGIQSRVLGPLLGNCLVALPVAGSFTGRCSTAHQAVGTGRQPAGVIGPGCTGETASGQMVRRMDGQCGLWTIGIHPLGLVIAPINPQRIPEPASEKGLGPTSKMPGRYDGPVRILDGRIDSDSVQFPTVINNNVPGAGTQVRDYGALLSDLQKGGMQPAEAGGVSVITPTIPDVAIINSKAVANAVVPARNYVWAWYGDWSDLNKNGVLDHCFYSCRGTVNEFTWLGSCLAFSGDGNNPRVPESIIDGICREDPNPNSDPPGEPCADPDSVVVGGCALTEIAFWFWPGNHHGNGLVAANGGTFGDYPGRQVFTWVSRVPIPPSSLDADTLNLLNCGDSTPTCDEIDRDLNGDPLLGAQDELTPDGTMSDRTGDNRNNVDTTRQWAGYTGGDSFYWGDDGLLITMIQTFGVNCAPSEALPHLRNLNALPGTSGGCTFMDVDRQVSILPQAQDQLVGADCNASTPEPECPTGGLKATARTQWKVVRDGTPGITKLGTSLAQSSTVYQTSAGPLQGAVDDQLASNGWTREPNVGSATYRDAAGVTQTVTEQYVGVAHTNCEDAAVFPPDPDGAGPLTGDTRNPTAAHDAESDEAAHRGFCNVHVGGAAQPAYRDYALSTFLTADGPEQIGRGWIDLQAVRGVVSSTECCANTATIQMDVNANLDPEGTAALPAVRDPTDHRRTMGPGRYFFAGYVGLWADRPYEQDESLFPQAFGTVTSTYPPAGDSFPQGDGWVGTVARAGGQWHYRGFGFGTCPDYATDKDRGNASGLKGSHDAAECNPYKDGNVDNPQDYTLTVNQFTGVPLKGEFQGNIWNGNSILTGCDEETIGPIYVAPSDGELDTQIITATEDTADAIPRFVFGAYGPGKVDPLAMEVRCVNVDFQDVPVNYNMRGTTALYWASGGAYDSLVTWVDADVNITLRDDQSQVLGVDHVRDVDVYHAYALPNEPAATSWPTVPQEAIDALNSVDY